MNEEDAVRKAGDEKPRLGMEAGASDVGVVLVEKVSLGNAPLEIVVVVFIRVLGCIVAQHVLPHEEGTVFADRVDGFLVLGEPCAHDVLPMAAQCGLRMAFFLVKTPYPCRHVLGCAKEEARVAGPFYALDGMVVPCVDSVSHKRREFQVAFSDIWRGRCMPDFDLPA